MATIQDLQDKYEDLGGRFDAASEETIDASGLLCFEYEYSGHHAEVVIDTDEFTAVCPGRACPTSER